MKPAIVFNGVEYASPDEMPADVRARFQEAMNLMQDRNGNGVPDLLEKGPWRTGFQTRVFTDSRQLSPEDRALVDQSLETVGFGNRPVPVETHFTLAFRNGDRTGSGLFGPHAVRRILSQAIFLALVGALVLLILKAWPH